MVVSMLLLPRLSDRCFTALAYRLFSLCNREWEFAKIEKIATYGNLD